MGLWSNLSDRNSRLERFNDPMKSVLLWVFVLGLHASSIFGAPLVLGKAKERFGIGPLLHQDDFKNLEDWIVQLEENEAEGKPSVRAHNNTLDCLLPGRGCTIWFKTVSYTHLTLPTTPYV